MAARLGAARPPDVLEYQSGGPSQQCASGTRLGAKGIKEGAARLRERLEERRARLKGGDKALRFSEHLEGDGEAIFRHAGALGLGIISKRRDARCRSGRSLTWLKIENLAYKLGRLPCETLAPLTIGEGRETARSSCC
jgi:ATP-dependent DNA ligase